MFCAEKALVVFVDSSEARASHPDWPAEIFLAICLMPSGDCELIVFHQEEFGDFLPRLMRHLGLKNQDMCVVPKIAGYPTRSFLYSDERRLMRLVAETPSIVDEAADYAVNFAYALEEGLDPARLLGLEKVTLNATKTPARFTLTATKATPDVPETRAASSKAFDDGPRHAPGPGFRSALDMVKEEGADDRYAILPEAAGWVAIERLNGRGNPVRIINPEKVFLSDDGRVMAFAMEPAWSWANKLPSSVSVQASELPARMRKLLAANVGRVSLSVDAHFLLVQFAAGLSGQDSAAIELELTADKEVAAEAQIPVVAAAKLGGYRRFWPRRGLQMKLASSIALLLVLGLGLQFFTPASAVESSAQAPIDWNKYRLSQGAKQAG